MILSTSLKRFSTAPACVADSILPCFTVHLPLVLSNSTILPLLILLFNMILVTDAVSKEATLLIKVALSFGIFRTKVKINIAASTESTISSLLLLNLLLIDYLHSVNTFSVVHLHSHQSVNNYQNNRRKKIKPF